SDVELRHLAAARHVQRRRGLKRDGVVVNARTFSRSTENRRKTFTELWVINVAGVGPLSSPSAIAAATAAAGVLITAYSSAGVGTALMLPCTDFRALTMPFFKSSASARSSERSPLSVFRSM